MGLKKKRLINKSKKLKIDDRVEFLDNLSLKLLVEYYNKSSFLVLPSFSETTGLVILEAFACGKPAIGTSVGDIPNIIKDGYNGFLVEPANVEQLKEKLEFLLQNPELCQEMGKNARKTVEKKYSWGTIAKQTVEVYEKVLEGER